MSVISTFSRYVEHRSKENTRKSNTINTADSQLPSLCIQILLLQLRVHRRILDPRTRSTETHILLSTIQCIQRLQTSTTYIFNLLMIT